MTLKPTRIALRRDDVFGAVDPRIFGGFLEHMGRAVYDGVALQVRADGPAYPNRRYGQVPYLDTSAILGADRLHRFVVNRSLDSAAPVQLQFGGANLAAVVDAELLTGPAPRACNTFAAPEVVAARPFTGVRLSPGSAEALLPPLSRLAATVALAVQS